MNKRKLVTYRGEYNMEDDYKVTVSLSSSTVGSTDEKFPDSTVIIEFDATDVQISAVLRKFQDLLNAMGYVTDGRHLGLIDGDQDY
jgi:hypothetical protein